MAENKKKSSWFFLLVVAIAFVVLVYFLLVTFYVAGKNQAENAVQDKMLAYATAWGERMSGEIDKSAEYGAILSGIINDQNIAVLNSQNVVFADEIVKNTAYYRVILVDSEGRAKDNTGELTNIDFYSKLMYGNQKSVQQFYFLEEDDLGNKNVILCTVPVESRGYLMLFFEPDEMADKYVDTGYEDTSFALLFKKDGTILKTLKCFKDTDSRFVMGENFLNAIQEGSSKSNYNNFKSKLYNINGCAIKATYLTDERTIVCVPLGIEDWYMGVGVRQYFMQTAYDAEVDKVRNTTIKLAIAFTVFTGFMLVSVVVNTTRAKEKGRVLEDKADMDLLTELTNKTATERLIAEYMLENPNGRGVLFILDIDNFKKVNDTMGHAFGDTLLKTLGKEIRTEFRVTDIVGRTGGDEFMIFLKDVKDDLIIEREANRVTHFFHDFKAGGDYVKYSATASIGAAVFPEDGKQFKDLYVSADQALYRAKKRGKNQLVFFNEQKYGK